MDETKQTLDQEDQMAEALAELRAEKLEPEKPAEQPAAESPVPAEKDAEQLPEATTAKVEKPASPEDELRKVQADLQKARSEVGRVNALNRLYNETKAQLENISRENAELKKSREAAPVAVDDDAISKLAEVAEKVKDFPELAGIVAAVDAAIRSVDTKAANVAKQTAAQVIQPLEGLRNEAEQRRQQETKAAYEAAMGEFQSSYPTAVEVIKTPEFDSWVKTAPKPVQEAFLRGQTPQEALAVMDAYDAHLRRTGKQPIAQYPTPAQPSTPAKAVPSSTQRLQAAAGLPSRNSGSQGGLPPADDFEASLDYFRRKRARAAA